MQTARDCDLSQHQALAWCGLLNLTIELSWLFPFLATNILTIERSKKARAKAATKKTVENLPVHSFRTLMVDLATIVKNKFQSNGLEASLTFEKITQPTLLQQKALDLLDVSLICTQ